MFSRREFGTVATDDKGGKKLRGLLLLLLRERTPAWADGSSCHDLKIHVLGEHRAHSIWQYALIRGTVSHGEHFSHGSFESLLRLGHLAE